MRTVIIDGRMDNEGQRRLMLYGYNVITMPKIGSLGEAISSHPDTLLFKYKNELITSCEVAEAAPYIFSDIRELHPSVTVRFTADAFGKSYPSDTLFNALRIGNKIFAKTASISDAVLELAKREGLTVVDVKQGYPACSTLVLSDSAAVTADRGLAKVFRQNGIEVTEIREGFIELPPYEYGFIGGATAVDGNRLFCFGELDSHPDGELIRCAAERLGLCVTPLLGGRLTDLGGAVFFE